MSALVPTITFVPGDGIANPNAVCDQDEWQAIAAGRPQTIISRDLQGLDLIENMNMPYAVAPEP